MSESPPDNPDRSDASSQELLLSQLMQAMNDVVVDELGIAGVVVDEHFQILQALGDFRSFVQLPERGFSTHLLDILTDQLKVAVETLVRENKKQGSDGIQHLDVPGDNDPSQFRVAIRPLEPQAGQGVRYFFAFIPRLSKQDERLQADEVQAGISESDTQLSDLQKALDTSQANLQDANQKLLAVYKKLHTQEGEYEKKLKDLAQEVAYRSQESEARYRTLYEDDPVMHINLEYDTGNIINCNAATLKRLGYENKTQIVGRNVLEIVHADSQSTSIELIAKLQNEKKLVNEETALVTVAGEKVPVLLNLSVMMDEHGVPSYTIDTLIDMTELKIIQNELSTKTAVLEQVLEGAAAGYWDWMIQAGTEYLSPTFKSMFGYEDHEIENSPEAWQRIIHPDDLPGVFACFEKHVASRGEVPFDNEVRYFHKDGSIVWVYCRGKVIEWDDSDPKDVKPVRMVGCHVDITRLKHIQETLEISNQELTQFAYVASHDLQEPLRTINSFVTLIQKEYGDTLDGDAVEYFSFIAESAQRMSNLTMDLLEYSRIGHEKKKGPVKLNEVISQVMDDMRATLESSSAEFLLDDLPAIQGYESELRLLFQNLFSNAIKFTRKERVPMITVQCEKIAGAYRVTVKDNGIGIEPRYQDRIFQIFQRLHSRKKYEGTGIGLAACKKVVELHGGQIEVISDPENRPEEGTTFRFTLAR